MREPFLKGEGVKGEDYDESSFQVPLVIGDRRSRLRKAWDRLPWSTYSRLVRQWKRKNT